MNRRVHCWERLTTPFQRPFRLWLGGDPTSRLKVLLANSTSSPRENFLGLDRKTARRRHLDSDLPERGHPRHHPRKRPTLPQPVPRRRRHAQPGNSATRRLLRRADRDDAQTPPHPRPRPRHARQNRTKTKPRSPHRHVNHIRPRPRPPTVSASTARPDAKNFASGRKQTSGGLYMGKANGTDHEHLSHVKADNCTSAGIGRPRGGRVGAGRWYRWRRPRLHRSSWAVHLVPRGETPQCQLGPKYLPHLLARRYRARQRGRTRR